MLQLVLTSGRVSQCCACRFFSLGLFGVSSLRGGFPHVDGAHKYLYK